MQGRKPVRLALTVALASMVTLAFASTASATVVKPTSTKTTASLQAGTYVRFIPKNAFLSSLISCKKSTATFTTPTAVAKENNNTNKLGTGTYSRGEGSVSMGIEGKPLFEECSLREVNPEKPEEAGTEIAPATVTASTNWILAGSGVITEVAFTALSMPQAGVTITLNVNGACTVTLAPTQAGAITGSLPNSTHRLRLDGQLPVAVNSESACVGLGSMSPFQLEAEYGTTAGGAGKELEILP